MSKWWENAVIYQIYPRSFMDSNNDGNGDIKGIISKLDYLKLLNVDAIWLSPIYASPMVDNGYDVSDYYSINPMFGTMEDFDELIIESKKRNIRILMDLVTNHTSIEHEFFKKAISSKKNKYQNYYYFRDTIDDKKSSFGGSSWEYVKKINKYYYHYFDKTQADLNWENKNVRKEVINIIKFWMDKGVSGFRLDAIELISKDLDKNILVNGPKIHEYLNEINRKAFSKYKDCMTVGEGWPTPEIALDYTMKDRKELNLLFQFDTPTLDWNFEGYGKYDPIKVDFKKLKDKTSLWQYSLNDKSNNALFFENHDLGRSVSRYGSEEYRELSAKALATYLFFLKGTTFIYQGEEIGSTNPSFTLDEYNDCDTLTKHKELVLDTKVMTEERFMKGAKQNSRDNSRTPMQWNDSINAGFSLNNPWLKVNSNYSSINVENNLKNKHSVLNFYLKLINIKKKTYKSIISKGRYEEIINDNDSLFIFKRIHNNKEIVVFINFSKDNINYDLNNYNEYKIVISNYNIKKISDISSIKPYEAFAIIGDNYEEN